MHNPDWWSRQDDTRRREIGHGDEDIALAKGYVVEVVGRKTKVTAVRDALAGPLARLPTWHVDAATCTGPRLPVTR